MLSRRTYAWSALVLAVLLFAGFNIFVVNVFTSARLDLTQNGQFSLSDGTRRILADLKEPVTLKFYYSREVGARFASTESYSGRVRDLLGEYVALARGKIIYSEIDPAPFTPEEDQANADGMTPAPTDTGEVVYFGLAASNSIDGKETISYFVPAREAYLEYDLSALIYRLATPKKPKLAVVSGLPLLSPQPMAAYVALAQQYDVQDLGANFAAIPPGIDLLLLAHPPGLSRQQLTAIDQFVLKGGKALVFVDPMSELAQQNPGMQPSSNLEPLLTAWGVGYNPANVVLDAGTAQRVAAGDDPRNPTIAYPLWLHLTPDDFNRTDPISAALQSVNVASVGSIAPLKTATTHFNTLLGTSSQTSVVPRNVVSMVRNPEQLAAMVQPGGNRYAIAARIYGPARTAFPGAGVTSGNINVVLAADSDLFDDRFWVRMSGNPGRPVAQPFADNGAFILNAVESLTGSQDLISLRTRAPGDHPFTKVRALRSAAEVTFRETEQSLQARLNAATQTLASLQQGGKGAGISLTAKEKAEIESTRQGMAQTRSQLRDVQRNLRANIDDLGKKLAFINIALVPLLLCGFVLVAAVIRRGKKRSRA